ncbi:hypothetical protein AB0B09_42025, partial [Streptomyces sp. NPDC044948]
MLLKTFRWAFAVTALGLAAGVLYDGWAALGIVAILTVLEISLSFDTQVGVPEVHADDDARVPAQRDAAGPP